MSITINEFKKNIDKYIDLSKEEDNTVDFLHGILKEDYPQNLDKQRIKELRVKDYESND